MARKKNDADMGYLFGLLGLVILSVFLINTLFVYQYYNNKYKFPLASARVTDTWNIIRFMPLVIPLGALICLCFSLLMPSEKSAPHLGVIIFISIPVLFLTVLFFLMLSARLATTQAGLLIYRDRGFFLMPTDWNKNTFTQNIFQLRIIGDMFTMEKLELAAIKKITREGGKTAFIHGVFGTRKITWRDRQKRDECIAALELACGKRLGSHI